MSDFIDARLEPGLWLACDWSLRWALLIAVVAAWFAIRPPRSAAVRLALCQLTLVAGLALPLVPHWWGSRFLPARANADVAHTATGLSTADSRDESSNKAKPRPVVAMSTPPTLARHLAAPSDVEPPKTEASPPREALSTPLVQTAQPLGPWRITLLLAAGLWAASAGLQLLRLVVASVWLKLLCRKTELPSRRSLELFECCRQEMRLRRSVRLGIHPGVSAPLVVGGRSIVLVPPDWDGLAPEAQRAVLWHELAHVARFDDLAKVAEEMVRALFFFHPLAHWLLNRIDGYREEVCDATVLRRGVAGPTLAEILVDFSRRSAAARSDAAVKPALPFFHRRSVRRRVAELLEEETVVRWSAPLARRQIASLGLLAAVALAGLGSFGLDAANSQASEPAPPPKIAEPRTRAAGITRIGPWPKSDGLTTAAESPTLRRILANWKARQDRTKSLHLAWDSQIPPAISETPEGQRLFRARVAQQTAERAFSKAVARLRNGEQPDRELSKAQALLKAAQAELELAQKNETRPNVRPPLRVLHNELWIDGEQRIRIEQSFTRGNGYRYVRDGMTMSTLAWRPESGQPPKAKIWSGDARPDVEALDLGLDFTLQDLVPGPKSPRLRTPSMIFRPFGPGGWRPEDFRLIAEDAVIANTHYVEIAHLAANPEMSETFYVDPARDDVIIFKTGQDTVEGSVPNPPPSEDTDRFALEIEYQLDRDRGWAPTRWKAKCPHYMAAQFYLNTVTALTINETFPAETFALGFAPHTVVFDSRTSEKYVIADDGSKANVLKFDSDKSLRIHELLESRTGFTIDPQPLKDALDFIATRYDFRMLFDDKAFAQRKIKTGVEVACKQSGIRLRELLRKLLGQVDRSADFKIENCVLRIEPVDWVDYNPHKPPPTAPREKARAK